jgi:hypothetical protein
MYNEVPRVPEMDQSVGIYQHFYKPGILDRLDSGFIALDWMSNPLPALRELALHHHIATRQTFLKHRLTGLLSPKFYAKTNLTSAQVYDWIAENPGYEIYLISGSAFRPYTQYYAIERHEISHGPFFERRMRSLCRVIGFDLPECLSRQTNKNICGGNYWIATADFWKRWTSDVIEPIFTLFDRRHEADELFQYCDYAAPTPVYQMVFMYERMMDYYIARHGINALYYPWTAERVLGLEYHPSIRKYLEEIVPEVDRIDARGAWTAEERRWLRERYDAVRLPYTPDETLSADPLDFDLPRRYPDQLHVGNRTRRLHARNG